MVGVGNIFPTVSVDAIDFAKRQCLLVLKDDRTPERVRQYYDAKTNYAGATFAGLEPNASDEMSSPGFRRGSYSWFPKQPRVLSRTG